MRWTSTYRSHNDRDDDKAMRSRRTTLRSLVIPNLGWGAARLVGAILIRGFTFHLVGVDAEGDDAWTTAGATGTA